LKVSKKYIKNNIKIKNADENICVFPPTIYGPHHHHVNYPHQSIIITHLHLALVGRVEVRIAACELLVKLFQEKVREGRIGRARAECVCNNIERRKRGRERLRGQRDTENREGKRKEDISRRTEKACESKNKKINHNANHQTTKPPLTNK
jgi:hypothetical protein